MTHPRTPKQPARTVKAQRDSQARTPARATRSDTQPNSTKAAPVTADGAGSRPASRRKREQAKPQQAKLKRRDTPKDKPKTERTNGKQSLPVYTEPRAGKRPEASCTACGLCCTYVAIETDGPSTVKRATQLLWYVYHEGVSLYVNADEWMVQFDTTCIHLQPDYRCGVYATRPHICREFSEKDCEVNTGDDGHTFHTASEFMAYLKQTRPRMHGFVSKHFAPPEEPKRATREMQTPFERRFQAVLSRRKALGV